MFPVLPVLLLIPGQIPILESPDFSRQRQIAAVSATVRITNTSNNKEGSGVLVGQKGQLVYLLTARHLVEGSERLQVTVFAEGSYPKPSAVYKAAQVVAKSKELPDLALVRFATADPLPGFARLCAEGLTPKDDAFTAFAVGCDEDGVPTGVAEKVMGKKLLRRQEKGETAPFWEVDRKLSKGKSGGPLFDKGGRLLGICSGTNRDKTYFAHPDEIRAFLKRHEFHFLVEDKAEK